MKKNNVMAICSAGVPPAEVRKLNSLRMNNVFEFELCSLPLALRTYLVLNGDCAGEPPALQSASG